MVKPGSRPASGHLFAKKEPVKNVHQKRIWALSITMAFEMNGSSALASGVGRTRQADPECTSAALEGENTFRTDDVVCTTTLFPITSCSALG